MNITKLFRFILMVHIICFGLLKGFSQDMNFSQFYNSPITLNPANTGNHDYNWRFINNYRSQWRSLENPYTTIAIAYDHQYYYFAQRFSWSIYYLNDQSGNKSLSTNKFYVSGSYHYEMRHHKIHGGLQFGVVSKKFTTNNLSFPDQFNIATGQFDPSLPTLEKSYNSDIFYPDLNLGVSVERDIGRFEPELGIALYHVISPKESFLDEKNHLPNEKVLIFGGKAHITKKIYTEPWFVFFNRSRSNAMLYGLNIYLPFPKNSYNLSHFIAGSFFRDGVNQEPDAVIFNTGIKFEHLQITLNYDYNISGLKTVTNNRGAFEFSLILLGPTSNLTDITIPCERY